MGCFSFEHDAMATTFVIRIHHENEAYARQAAMEAFRHCDLLESQLSRFVESSSISRLNNGRMEMEIPVSIDSYLCLKQSLKIADETKGAFDVAFQSRQGPSRSYEPPLTLSSEAVAATLLRENPQIDLGGIGKGYAIDQMAGLLEEWEIESALLSGGWSTLLALGHPPGAAGWPVGIRKEDSHILPPGLSISASGFSVQEDHVRDPSTGERAGNLVRSWAISPSAAVSDALSTAFLVMDPSETSSLLDHYSDHGAVLQVSESEYNLLGLQIPHA